MDKRLPQIRFSVAPPFVPPTSNRWDIRKCIAASTTKRLARHCIHAAETHKGTQIKNLRLSLMDGEKTVFSADAAEIQSQVDYPTNSVSAPLEKLVERVRQAARDDDSGFLQRQMERAQRDLPELEAKAGQPFPKADELATKRARLKELVSVLDANNKQASEASEPATEDDDAAYMGAPVAGGTTPFNISGSSVALPVEESVSTTTAADEVENRIGQFSHQPPVLIRDSAQGVIPGATASDGIAGAVHGGKIHLFLDQLGSRRDVQTTLFHELFHYGLRRFLTREQTTST